MKHSLAEVAKGLKDNKNLSQQIRTNLATLSEVIPTESTNTKIRIDTFHEKNAVIDQDSQALDVIRHASQNMQIVVEPILRDDMDESQRILATVEAQEATVRNQQIVDGIGFIGCSSYDPITGACISGDGIL